MTQTVIAVGKFCLILGGFVGFSGAFIFGIMAGSDVNSAILEASFGCLAGALLMKGFVHVFYNSIRSAAIEKSKEKDRLDDKTATGQESRAALG